MITDIILILLVGLVSGIIARSLGQPLFLGYIFAGVIVGPHTGGVTVSDIPQIEQLADIVFIIDDEHVRPAPEAHRRLG